MNQFQHRNVFIDYEYEDVLFRYDHKSRHFFRKFYGEQDEMEVKYDNELLNEAIRFGDEINEAKYKAGKPDPM